MVGGDQVVMGWMKGIGLEGGAKTSVAIALM